MATMRERARNALNALLGREAWVEATVRPSDVATSMYSRKQTRLEQLKRWSGWVKVASSRQATAVASQPIRVCRDSSRGRTAFKTRRADSAVVRHARTSAGTIARKMAVFADDAIEEVTDPNHPLVRWLQEPNPYMGGYELRVLTEMLQGLCGDFGWYVVNGENGWPVEAWPMYPQFTEVVADERNLISHYTYGRGEENRQVFPVEQVIFYRRPNPFGDPYRGIGDLYACALAADISTRFDSFAYHALKNAVQPGLVVAAPGFRKQQRDEAYAELRRREGDQNAAKNLMLDIPKDAIIKTWEPSAKEAGYLGGASDRAAMEKIAAAFDVPPDILCMADTNKAHGVTAEPHWMRYGVAPRCRWFEDTLNAAIPRLFVALEDPGLFVIVENPVHDDLDKVTVRENIQVLGGWGTINEARAAVGKLPVEGGDELGARPSQPGPDATMPPDDQEDAEGDDGVDAEDAEDVAPATDVQATALNGAQVTALAELADRVAAGQLPADSAVALARAAFPLVAEATINAVFDPLRSFTPKLDAGVRTTPGPPAGAKAAPCGCSLSFKDAVRRIRAKAVDGAPPPDETVRKLQAAIARAFRTVSPSITGWVASFADPSKITADGIARAVQESGLPRMIVDDVGEQAMPLFASGWDTAFTGVNRPPPRLTTELPGTIGMDWDSANEFAREAARNYRVHLSRSVRETTAESIRQVIEEGVATGKGVPELAQDVRNVMGDLADYAAERIARTESQRAYHSGRVAAWKESGVVAGKRFILSGNPCEMCREAERQFTKVGLDEPMVPLGGSFSWMEGGVRRTVVNDYEAIYTPPMHPNCACDMIAVWSDDVAGTM